MFVQVSIFRVVCTLPWQVAVLTIFDFLALGSLKKTAMDACRSVLPHLPGAKWVLCPDLPKGSGQVVLTARERELRPEGEARDAGVSDEEWEDCLVDAEGVQLPALPIAGGQSKTTSQRLSALSKDRQLLKQTMLAAGGKNNPHFDLPCSIMWQESREGRSCTDGIVPAP